MYHYFYDKSNGEIGENSNYMEVSDFDNQMKYLSENNYYFPTWDEVASFIDGKQVLPEKSVVIRWWTIISIWICLSYIRKI